MRLIPRYLRQGSRVALAVNAWLLGAWLLGALPVAAEVPIRILALGDSLTAGYGLARGDAFPAKLQAALGRDGVAAEVVNGGVSGDTTTGGLGRLDWLLRSDPAGGFDALIVELGANDGLRGLDPATSRANLDALIAIAKRRGLEVLLTGMLAPPNLGAEYGKQFNGLFRRLADVHGIAFYPFFLEGVAARPALNQADALHPNAAGVDVIVENILPLVKKLVARARKRRRAD